jgi:hypothetical protein
MSRMHDSVASDSATPLRNFDALFAPDTAMPATSAATYTPSTFLFSPAMPVCAYARTPVLEGATR